MIEVKIGQLWRRWNEVLYRVTDIEPSNVGQKVKLVPLGKYQDVTPRTMRISATQLRGMMEMHQE